MKGKFKLYRREAFVFFKNKSFSVYFIGMFLMLLIIFACFSPIILANEELNMSTDLSYKDYAKMKQIAQYRLYVLKGIPWEGEMPWKDEAHILSFTGNTAYDILECERTIAECDFWLAHPKLLGVRYVIKSPFSFGDTVIEKASLNVGLLFMNNFFNYASILLLVAAFVLGLHYGAEIRHGLKNYIAAGVSRTRAVWGKMAFAATLLAGLTLFAATLTAFLGLITPARSVIYESMGNWHVMNGIAFFIGKFLLPLGLSALLCAVTTLGRACTRKTWGGILAFFLSLCVGVALPFAVMSQMSYVEMTGATYFFPIANVWWGNWGIADYGAWIAFALYAAATAFCVYGIARRAERLDA